MFIDIQKNKYFKLYNNIDITNKNFIKFNHKYDILFQNFPYKNLNDYKFFYKNNII